MSGRPKHRIPASYYRGGTSRALIFNRSDLPPDRDQWAEIFRGTIGSPDPYGRQLDGMGGGISSLSKICVVGPATIPGADVDYTFVQVEIKGNFVDYAGNCGNMSAAIGPYAYDLELIDRDAVVDTVSKTETTALATVRIHNTNTGKVVAATFPVIPGVEAESSGEFSIDGVSGTASKIQLDFLDPAGSKTRSLFPSSKIVDIFHDLPGFDGPVEATLIDAANPAVFISPSTIGLEDATILPSNLEQCPALLEKLDVIRTHAAVRMGMVNTLKEAQQITSIPKICIISPPITHKLLNGKTIDACEIDLVARAISVGQPHRAIPITLSLATAAAAKIKGTIVNQAISGKDIVQSPEIVIGHPSGSLTVGAKFEDNAEIGEIPDLLHVTVFRTARRLFEGIVFWKS
ncbi:PrpF protein [Lipomyces oligophaga]|uniref:PrpF protein n=1 Tax=Lipomyces oligophaga TaxID=45792 RepID=UPI0034CD731E